jgi:hypothetical protein
LALPGVTLGAAALAMAGAAVFAGINIKLLTKDATEIAESHSLSDDQKMSAAAGLAILSMASSLVIASGSEILSSPIDWGLLEILELAIINANLIFSTFAKIFS